MAMGSQSVMRSNRVSLGATLGAIIPLVAFAVILASLYTQMPEESFWHFLRVKGTLARLLCMATLFDAVLFFVAVYSNRLLTARGTLGATIVYAIITVVLALAV